MHGACANAFLIALSRLGSLCWVGCSQPGASIIKIYTVVINYSGQCYKKATAVNYASSKISCGVHCMDVINPCAGIRGNLF